MALPPFQVLLDDHGRDVQRFLVASTGRDEADDCFQETCLSALRAYPRLHNADHLRAWLFTIAHRKALDAHRSRARRAVPVADLPEEAVHDEPAADEALWGRVRALGPKQRAAVTLRFVGDLPYEVIGEVLECSPEAARRNVHEGLKNLREDLLP
jgi:RNA polymerase sigma factor (sigma-70 family)